MNYLQLKEKCKKGFVGRIPGWNGYVKYKNGELVLVNNDYVMQEEELQEKIKERTDLFYII